jgi:hypothetical protein
VTKPAPDKPIKHLEVCPKCSGYMRPISPFKGDAKRRDWKDETFHRSFGGVELKKFVCEKCHHVEVYQIDDLAGIKEDD